MKVIAFNGSARKEGNTHALLNLVLDELKNEGMETELISFAGKHLQGCIACYKCFKNRDRRCSVDKDTLNDCIEKMIEADGILLGSPTYFADVSANMKALIERAGLVARANEDMFRRKAGAGVVAVRRAGSSHVFNSLNHFFLIGQMIVPGSSYWNLGIGSEPGEVLEDEEGVRTMKTLGRNMAWLLRKTQV
ncbi:2-amino-4-deoxychorismate dehydrogenase [bacterium BMS3Abin07]|nr:2-amino-4-deoxychorismate dehydrogenase [bacterium BMS3Abin07]GBE32911.1 2-amino-4-deoxychorismate dehydrogenase [bacterium BMS3Bbin05]HDO23189.1 flavodoxin family protein [Nitrospirota bacterium]HDZ88943.1 flavodoxin family protein [Nitrospirota bacterium]